MEERLIQSKSKQSRKLYRDLSEKTEKLLEKGEDIGDKVVPPVSILWFLFSWVLVVEETSFLPHIR